MFFIIWFLLWVILSQSIYSLIIPLFVLFIRTAYKDREMRLIKKWAFVFLFVLFILNFYLVKLSYEESSLRSLRLLVISGLFIHIVNGLQELSFKRFPALEFYLHYGIRLFSLVYTRQKDMWYMLKQRYRFEKGLNKVKLLLMLFSNYLLEIEILRKQILMIVYERGGIPISSQWRILKPKKYIFKHISNSFVGDMLILILIIIPSFLTLDILYPSIINNTVNFLVELIS